MDSSVEGMINWDSSCIPERYIRSNEEDINIDEDSIFVETPVLDFELLSVSCTQELQKLDMACLDWGFFQVVNHGVTEEMMQKMNKVGDEFFKLPMKEKMKYWTDPITKQGYGQPVPPTQEQKLNWFEPLLLVVHPSEFIKEELWPTTPPQFKDIVEEYSNEIRRVSKVLLGSLSTMMGMEQNALLQLHKVIVEVLGLNYYPICSKPNLVLGLNPHSDISTITILMQDSDVPGLQIRHKGAWIPIKPVPNALMVVIGDTIEMWSNGKYKSVEHRAVTNKSRERMSYATFIDPHNDAEIEPLEHMLDAKQPLKMYKKVTYGDYFMHSLKRRHESKEQADFFQNKF